MKKELLALLFFALVARSSPAQQKAIMFPHFQATAIQQALRVTGTPAQKKSLYWTAQFDTLSRNLYTYDSQKRLVLDIEQKDSTGIYINESKTSTYYIPTNNTAYPDSSVSYSWNNNVWERAGSVVFTFQDLSKGLYKRVSVESALLSFVINFYYDNNNFIKYTTGKYKINIVIPSETADSIVYQTDVKGNPLTKDIFDWDDAQKVYAKSRHEINTYDANNNLLVNTVQKFDTDLNTLVNESRTTNTYNSFNNPTLSLDAKWNTTLQTWEDSLRTSTFYKNNTEYDSQLVEAWGNGAYVNQDKYIWSDAISGISTLPSQTNHINVFPNPASEKATITINLSTTQQVNVTVVDITGKQVMVLMNELLPAGIHTFNATTKNLAKGLYFVKLNSNNAQATQKLIVE